MKWRVLDTRQHDDWHGALNRLRETDVYFLPEYHRAYEVNGDGAARAFMAEEEDDLLFYPFMVRPIERVGTTPLRDRWWDIETVYGYSGPLCTTMEAGFLARAWSAFGSWCRESRIVAEFLRFNPLSDNTRYVDDSCILLRDRETVIMRLDCSEKDLWTGYPWVQRNRVRKAMASGLVVSEVPVLQGLDVFRSIYHATMDRRDALPYYHFSDAYFDALRDGLGDALRLFVVRDADRTVAAALFLLHEERIGYHLGGSDAGYQEAAPNNLLMHDVAEWGRQRGFRWLHLGGGRTPDPNDSLLRFKSKLSRSRLSFHIGKRVHNREVYDRLCAEWLRQSGVADRPAYFLLYRLEGRRDIRNG